MCKHGWTEVCNKKCDIELKELSKTKIESLWLEDIEELKKFIRIICW